MDFSLSQEQQLLKDSVERFVREKYEFEARCKLVATSEGYSQENWSMMAELGWLAVGFPEDHGGFGGGPVETMIIMEAVGQGLVLEPYLPSIVLGGNLVALGGSEEQKNALLPALGEGNLKLAFAYAERQARFDLFDVETTAKKDGGGYVINGEKGVVFHAATADKIIVSARTAGDSRDENGITLFIVDADAKGLTRRDYGTNDGGQASEVAFENVAVDADAVIGDVDGGYPTIEQVVELAIGALCAEAVGCMDYLKDATNEYLKTREQFGRPLGSFQVLQHRMVDMFINCEEARSLTYVAAARLGDDDAMARAKAIAAAKVQIGKSGKFVGQQTIQLHGGMGMTDELSVGHYFKRLTMIELTFGDQAHHLKRYMAMD